MTSEERQYGRVSYQTSLAVSACFSHGGGESKAYWSEHARYVTRTTNFRLFKCVLIGSEHILSLTDKISTRAIPMDYLGQNYLDGVSYWRSRHDRLISELGDLRARNSELQRRLDALESSSSSHDLASTSRKRTISSQFDLAVRPGKRLRTPCVKDSEEPSDDESNTTDSDNNQSGDVESEFHVVFSRLSLTICRGTAVASFLPSSSLPQERPS